MKSSIIMAVMFCFFTISANAQHDHAHDAKSQAKTAEFTNILTAYYDVKDALVASNPTAAAAKASAFAATLKGTNADALNGDPAAVKSLEDKLVASADKIAASKSLEKQRDLFADFSLTMSELIKTSGNGGEPVYEQYCPMKKAYWLSKEKTIRNPYYGKQMLTCGSVFSVL